MAFMVPARIPVLDLFAPFLSLSLGMWLVLHPFVTGERMPGDLGDASFNLSMLEFFYRMLLTSFHGGAPDFLNVPFYYPWPRVTNFSDTHWGDAVVYAVARGLGLSLLAAFRAWFVIGFALTYVSAFVSFRMLRLHSWGAAFGAFLFTFCLPMAAQVDHAQLVYRLWIPPAIVTLHHFIARRSLRSGATCVLFVALQLTVSIYLGAYLSLLLISYALGLLLFSRETWRRSQPHRGNAVEFVTASALIVVASAILGIVVVPYHQVQVLYGFERSWDEVKTMLPQMGSYLLAGASRLWPNLSSTFYYPPWQNEHQIFPGISTIIPLAWFLLSSSARQRQPLATPMLVATGGLFAVTIDLGGYSLYWFIYQVPGFSAIRAVTRSILVMMLPLSALLGMMIDDLGLIGTLRSWRQLLPLAFSAFMFVECSLIKPYSSKPSAWQARIEALEARIPKNLPADAVLVVASEPGWPGLLLTQADAEIAAVRFGIATLNGYSGSNPPSWRPMTTCVDVRDNLLAAKQFRQVHHFPEVHVSRSRLILLGINDCKDDDLIPWP